MAFANAISGRKLIYILLPNILVTKKFLPEKKSNILAHQKPHGKENYLNMASKIKKTIMFLCCTILVLFVALSAVFKVNFFQVIFLPTYIMNDELEYYNGFLPQSKISCPYSISNYQEKELDMWYFKDLTGKIKENLIGKDFWVYNDNFDILFCSNGKKYIRNDTHFSSDVTSDMVNSISFFEEHPVDVYKKDIAMHNISLHLNDEDISKLTNIIINDEYCLDDLDEIDNTQYLYDLNIAWYVIFELKNTEEFNYEGLCVAGTQRYYIVYYNDKMYLRDLNGNLKFIPNEIANKILNSELTLVK